MTTPLTYVGPVTYTATSKTHPDYHFGYIDGTKPVVFRALDAYSGAFGGYRIDKRPESWGPDKEVAWVIAHLSSPYAHLTFESFVTAHAEMKAKLTAA